MPVGRFSKAIAVCACAHNKLHAVNPVEPFAEIIEEVHGIFQCAAAFTKPLITPTEVIAGVLHNPTEEMHLNYSSHPAVILKEACMETISPQFL